MKSSQWELFYIPNPDEFFEFGQRINRGRIAGHLENYLGIHLSIQTSVKAPTGAFFTTQPHSSSPNLSPRFRISF